MTHRSGPVTRVTQRQARFPARALARTCQCQRRSDPTTQCPARAAQLGSVRTLHSAAPADAGTLGGPDLFTAGPAGPAGVCTGEDPHLAAKDVIGPFAFGR
jgi:hypothetical protein